MRKGILRLLPGSVALVVAASGAAGQGWSAATVHPDVHSYALVGGMAVDLDGINRSLAAQGFGDFASGLLSVGGGGHLILGRWILGGEGFGLVPRESATSSGSWRARITGGGGLANVGYVAVVAGRTSLYPIVGAGVGALRLQMTERGSPTFEDVMRSPGRGSALNRIVMLVQPALGLDHFIPVADVAGVSAGALVGIRAGYTFTPVTSAWYLDTMRLPGGVDQGMSGPFVRVVIGGGGRRPPGTAVSGPAR